MSRRLTAAEQIMLVEAKARIAEQARHLTMTQFISASAAIYQVHQAAGDATDPLSRAAHAATASALTALTGVRVPDEFRPDRSPAAAPAPPEQGAQS